MLFPENFLAGLIYGALAMTVMSTVWLLALLVRDWRHGELW